MNQIIIKGIKSTRNLEDGFNLFINDLIYCSIYIQKKQQLW